MERGRPRHGTLQNPEVTSRKACLRNADLNALESQTFWTEKTACPKEPFFRSRGSRLSIATVKKLVGTPQTGRLLNGALGPR